MKWVPSRNICCFGYLNYSQDELEQEVERLKENLSQGYKKPAKNRFESTDSPSHNSLSTPNVAINNVEHSSSEEICEVCERPGHDVFTCDLLRDETPAARDKHAANQMNGDPSDLFCVDCEGHGHVAADCPHSLDVF